MTLFLVLSWTSTIISSIIIVKIYIHGIISKEWDLCIDLVQKPHVRRIT